MANALVDRAQRVGKALAGAVAGAVISALWTSVKNPGSADIVQIPQTQAEWTAFAVSVAVGLALPWLKRNYPSVLQAEQQLAIANERVAQGKQSQ